MTQGRVYEGVPSPLRHMQTYFQNGQNNYFTGGPQNSGFSNVAVSSNIFYCYPFFVARNFRLKKFGAMVTAYTSQGAMCVGIYEDSMDRGAELMWFRRPGKKVISLDNVTVNAVGFYSSTLATPKTLFGGKMYWGAISVGSGTFSLGGTYFNFSNVAIIVTTFDAGTQPGGYAQSASYLTVMPENAPSCADGYKIQVPPMILFREPNQNGT